MKPFRSYLAAVALLLFCAVSPRVAVAQPQSGNLYGTVVDEQGQPLPGVTVTVTGQGDPQVQVTNAQGQFRFLGLPPGQRQIKAELEGFSTVEYPNVTIRAGRNTDLEVTQSPSVEDVITVTADAPLVEPGQTPTARDPWAILQTTPGVLTDRINVGGNEAGQQSQFTGSGGQVTRELTLEDFGNMLAGNDLVIPTGPPAAGAGGGRTYQYDPEKARQLLDQAGWTVGADGIRQKGGGKVNLTFGNVLGGTRTTTAPPAIRDGGIWLLTPQIGGGGPVYSVDGVVITDMPALGSSPSSYDFDSFEEMQVTTGGNDASLVPGGVVLNMVTKRGTNEWRGSGRYLISDEDWDGTKEQFLADLQAYEQANRGVTVEDYGAELGGPIIKDRLWIWGSYGTQELDLQNPGAYQTADGTDVEWDWNTVRDVAAKLTVDANGNDATSPNFDPNNIVQFGYGLDCNIPGYNLFTLPSAGAQTQNPCPEIRISLQNFFGTGVFQGTLPDPFQLGLPATALHTPANSGPLYVVNGVRGNPVDIHPDDIQDIQVLSGGSATNLYGSAGANGVIVVTTKSGGAGASPSRIDQIVVDPSDPSGNTVFATANGGVWKSNNFLTRDPVGPIWNQEKFGGEPSAYQIEDTHIFNSSFYLTGLYSQVSGGFQLAPQSTGGAVQVPAELAGDADLMIGWTPSLRNDMTWSDGQAFTADDVTFTFESVQAMTLDRTDFTQCPNGSWVGRFNYGDPIDLGNGSSFQPLDPIPNPCPQVDWSLFDAAGRVSFGTNWYIARALLEEEDEEPGDELVTGVEHALLPEFVVGLNLTYRQVDQILEETPEPIRLNPEFLNGLPGIPLNQRFGSRFRFVWRLPSQQGPGGSVETVTPASLPEGTSVLLVSLGESTGEAFRAHVLSDRPVSIEGMAALEPVAAPPEQVARFEQMMKEAGAVTATIEAYCTQFDGLVPPAGTAYRFAPPEVQKAFEPLARVLEAGQRIKDAGGLVPDTQLDTYFPAISQWAVWTREKGFDLESFGEAWLGHVKKNVEQAGERMTDELEQAVRERIPGRWRDIEKILAEADRI